MTHAEKIKELQWAVDSEMGLLGDHFVLPFTNGRLAALLTAADEALRDSEGWAVESLYEAGITDMAWQDYEAEGHKQLRAALSAILEGK